MINGLTLRGWYYRGIHKTTTHYTKRRKGHAGTQIKSTRQYKTKISDLGVAGSAWGLEPPVVSRLLVYLWGASATVGQDDHNGQYYHKDKHCPQPRPLIRSIFDSLHNALLQV